MDADDAKIKPANTKTQVIRTLISDEMLSAGLMALIEAEEAGTLKGDLVCHIYAAMRVLECRRRLPPRNL